jgi:hypothetical protein
MIVLQIAVVSTKLLLLLLLPTAPSQLTPRICLPVMDFGANMEDCRTEEDDSLWSNIAFKIELPGLSGTYQKQTVHI